LLVSHSALQFNLLQTLVTCWLPAVQESVSSLQTDVKAGAVSNVKVLLSGSFVHVFIAGRLFALQLTGADAFLHPTATSHISWPLQNKPSLQTTSSGV
jgi:hypothetical protein